MKMKGWMTVMSGILLVLTLTPALALGATYYVDVSGGSDEKAGTSWAEAFKTINKAASVTQPGDLVRVNHGVYKEQITNPPAGTEAAPIVYEAIGNVTIDAEGQRNHGFCLDGSKYLTIKNFKITSARSHAIYVYRATGIRIENCWIVSSGYPSDTWAVNIRECSQLLFTHNLLAHNRRGLRLEYGSQCTLSKNTIVSTGSRGIEYYNDGNDARANIIVNNLVSGSGEHGIYLANFNGTSDRVLKNNVWASSAPNWRVDGWTGATWGDNLNLDPMFVSGTWFLSLDSPLIGAGTPDEATGRFSTIGALAVGQVSSGTADTWVGWVDQNGSAIANSNLVEFDVDGNIRLKSGVTQAGLYSPVVVSPDTGYLRSIRIEALQSLAVPSGEKQLIDQDNTSITPEIRYRYSDTSFSQTGSAPAWVTTNPNQRVNVRSKYFQAELVLRADGI